MCLSCLEHLVAGTSGGFLSQLLKKQLVQEAQKGCMGCANIADSICSGAARREVNV
jgi:hypothetical protein